MVEEVVHTGRRLPAKVGGVRNRTVIPGVRTFVALAT
jgi:hypothetical protein